MGRVVGEKGVRSPPFSVVPQGRGISMGKCSGGMDSPLCSGGGLSGVLHHDNRWCPTEFCGCPSPSAPYLSETSHHDRYSRASHFGLHSGLATIRLRPRISPSHSTPFFQDVFRSEGFDRQEADHRSVFSEQAAQKGKFQDGGPGKGGKVPLSRAVGGQVRSEGCLPSSPQGLLSVSNVSGQTEVASPSLPPLLVPWYVRMRTPTNYLLGSLRIMPPRGGVHWGWREVEATI